MLDYKKMEERLLSELKKNLKPKRFKHSIQVAIAASDLAKCYEVEQDKAHFAGLFHDYAKGFSKEDTLKFANKYDIYLDEYEMNSTQLSHGKIAAFICRKMYEVYDEDIINSIEYHTTGRNNMSTLEKIICLADYIEKGRDFDGVGEIRVLAYKDLDRALYRALNGTLAHLVSENVSIHPDTLMARNYLLEIIRKKD